VHRHTSAFHSGGDVMVKTTVVTNLMNRLHVDRMYADIQVFSNATCPMPLHKTVSHLFKFVMERRTAMTPPMSGTVRVTPA
jgi:hypothetical protein